ncbi:MAG TPA: glycoside hydrolase N-terminal domain-containing protein [Lachnospiraceae bacterium]|nr:glycoside hydrolase N-terminal domain-containing protein [Lachnospiraceae bacterium]
MKVIHYQYPYSYMAVEERKKILPERSVCSIAPAREKSDYFYTGNGSHRVDVSGNPYNEEIIVTQELLYEPQWAKTPLPPDLRPYLQDIRKYVMEGKPELADQLIDKAQKEAGMDQYMNLDAKIVYPAGSPRIHKAFSMNCIRQESKETRNYLRFLDMLTGKVTTHWENAKGVYENEILAAYDGDLVAMRFTAPKGQLDMEFTLDLPGGLNMFGQETMKNSTHTLKIEEDLATLVWGYNPEFGKKGYVAVLRFLPEGGSIEVKDDGIQIEQGNSLIIYAKAVKIEENFEFGSEDKIVKDFSTTTPDFDELVKGNDKYLGERMRRSQIKLANKEDYVLSGEELLKRGHEAPRLDAMLMDKLYDMGRFYQIIDTGTIPPMWGQHNINTNLQVCAGNNTGLFDEMDVYFKYYETKFDDFRINAKRLFNAGGLLASVHCDYDSGLFYHFSKTYPHYCWTGCLGWIFNELWGYYLCTGDLDFLRNRVVPGLKEIALFFADYACDEDENGKSIFYPSFSPEDPTPNPGYETVTCKSINPTRINSVMDIAICREVLVNLIDACETLGIEQENIAHWQDQLTKLPDYLLDEEGGLKEWSWPSIEENYNHRHVSHHYDLWPGRAVTPDREPEVAKAIMISNRKRGQQDDSAHGIIHRALCAIRLKDQDELTQNLSQLINHGFVRCNLSTAHFPYRGQFPDLQGAMPAILLEMCVFSMPGLVEFLPAMVADFPCGEIEGVWLYTWAKLHYLKWNEQGLEAVITSDRAQMITFRIRSVKAFLINGVQVAMAGDCAEYTFREKEEVKITISYQ